MVVRPAKLKWKMICFPVRAVLWPETKATQSAGLVPWGHWPPPRAAGSQGPFQGNFRQKWNARGKLSTKNVNRGFTSCKTLGVIFVFLKSARVAPVREKLLWGRFYLHFYFQLGSVHLWYNCEQLRLCSSHKDKRPDFNLNSGKAPIKQAKC